MKVETFSGKGDLLLTVAVGPNFSLLNDFPGRKKWVDRSLVIQSSGANLDYLMKNWPSATWSPEAEQIRDRYLSLRMQEENTRQEKTAPLSDIPDSSGYEFKTPPFAHQFQAFLLSRDREFFAFFHEQGTGKSKVIIDTAAYLWERGKIDALVIVARNGVHSDWIINKIPDHLPARILHTRTFYEPGKTNQSILDPFRKRPGKLHIISFNVEGFTSERAQELLESWLRNLRCMLVIDESQKIKNPKALRTKFLIRMSKLAAYRRIMTGTPVTRGIENLWSQMTFLHPDILGHPSFYTFRNQYCIMGGFQMKQVVRYQHVDELVKILDGHSHRVLKKDCLDIPEKIYKRAIFDLGPQQRKLYDSYRRDALAEVTAFLGEERALARAAELAVTKALRLQQIACGFYPGPEMERLPWPNPRLQLTLDQMEDTPTKQIVWARFADDVDALLKPWGTKAVGYYGRVSKEQRIRNLNAFMKSDKVLYFVATQAAAAEGHDLWMAESAVYHSNTSSLDQRLQSEDRCHRIGTRHPVLYTDIEARNTVDQRIIRCLRKNKSLANMITRDPVSIFMEDRPEDIEELDIAGTGDEMRDELMNRGEDII